MLKEIFTSVSSILPTRFLISNALKGREYQQIVAPFYHLVSNEIPLHIKHLYPVISPEQFVADLDFLMRYFSPIDTNDLHYIIMGERKMPKHPLFLSFDDGFREVLTVVAPILKSKGIPATFFVTPAFVDNADMLYRCKISLIAEKVHEQGNGFKLPEFLSSKWIGLSGKPKPFVERLMGLSYNDSELINRIAKELEVDFMQYLSDKKPYLALDEIKQLAEMGFTIGAHSLSHPNFADISLSQQINEVEESIRWIQNNVPNQPKLFALPFTNFGLLKEFYSHFLVNDSNPIDMMFGTAGLKPTNSSRFLQRIPMEVKGCNGKQIIKGEFFYYLAKSIIGKHKEYLPI